MLAATLRRHIAYGAFQDLQQRLLYTFAADIARNRRIFAAAGNLIDLINVDDADFSLRNVKVRCLNELQQDVLHVLAHITSFRQRGCIGNGKGNPQHPGQRLSQQRFANAGGAQQQNIALLKLHIVVLPAEDPLVVVIHCHRQHSFRVILPNHILIQACFDFSRGHDID